jgi:hypothetical protein
MKKAGLFGESLLSLGLGKMRIVFSAEGQREGISHSFGMERLPFHNVFCDVTIQLSPMSDFRISSARILENLIFYAKRGE